MSAAISTSVIIPVFQDADGIRTCLQALARQTMPGTDFEVIVVDNGSDPPLVIPECGLPHVSVVRCPTPGSYAARNAGVNAARGIRLAFTDADCVPDVRWLENGTRELDTAGRSVIVGGDVRFINPSRPTATSLYQTLVGFQQAQNIVGKGFSATANVFCTRQTFARVGPFAEILLSGGDREWAWRAGRAGIESIFVPDAIVETLPRTKLRGALRQARRVAAGRYQLKQSGLAVGRLDALRPHRGVFASFAWILSRQELRSYDKLRVLAVASLIKIVSVLESIRVRLGGRAERR